jgi:translation initiation factor IF-2
MMDHTGARMKEASPSAPALIMGWAEIPTAGDPFEATATDREARAMAEERLVRQRESQLGSPGNARERLANLLEQLRAEEAELRVILKTDTHGSLEALRESLGKIQREGGRIEIMHGAVGGINENDVKLAEVTESVIIGFNVRPDGKTRRLAEEKAIEIRTYGIIYELLDEIEQMLVGRLAPEEQEVVLGTAEVRAIFRVPRVGAVAGCYVTEGEIVRNARARLLRDGVIVFDGPIGSLRRFKDDVRTVASGFECGIGLEGFNDVKEGDVIEAYQIREIART